MYSISDLCEVLGKPHKDNTLPILIVVENVIVTIIYVIG